MKLVTNPTEKHLSDLQEWLTNEEVESGESFICNWNVIYNCYIENRLYIIESNSKAIAFLVWWEYKSTAEISILAVEPKQRKKGIGQFLVNSFFEVIKDHNVTTIKIQCKPPTSEGFWLSQGFTESEEKSCERINGIPIRNLYMYKDLNEIKL